MKGFAPLATGVVVLLGAGSALAQVEVERFNRQMEQIRRDSRIDTIANVPAGQRAYFDYGGYLTLQYLSIDDVSGANRAFTQEDVTLYGRFVLDGAHEFFVRARGYNRDYNDGDNLSGRSSGTDGFLERAYYRFNLEAFRRAYKGEVSSSDVAIRAGRDLVYWANGLTLSQVIDGVAIEAGFGNFAMQAIAGVTPKFITSDFDSSRPNFDRDTRRGFFGALAAMRLGDHRPFVYGLVQRDYNDGELFTVTDDTTGDGFTTNFDYNSFYIGIGSSGNLSDQLVYGIEAVYEGGDTLSSSFTFDDASQNATVAPQTRDNIQAWAVDAQLDYLLADSRNTRFSFEVLAASGDTDRLNSTNTFGGNKPGTTDHGFNGFGLVNTGLAFAPSASNLLMFRVGASTFPFRDVSTFRKLQVGGDFFIFNKLRSGAPIDETTSSGHFLGVEPDLFLSWQVTSDVTFAIRYGIFIPGDAVEADDKVRQFLYTGVTLAF